MYSLYHSAWVIFATKKIATRMDSCSDIDMIVQEICKTMILLGDIFYGIN